MKTGTCYLCKKENVPLTKEHIFPQCLGGKLTGKIYCKECNSKTGKEIDIELANNFGIFATFMDIKRERGENKPYIVKDVSNNQKIKIYPDGSAIKQFNVNLSECLEGAIYHMNGGKQKDIENKTKELENKFGKDNIKILYNEINQSNILVEMTSYISNDVVCRAIAKIAYSFACVKLPKDIVLSQPFDNIREYILGKTGLQLVSLNYENTDFMTDNRRPLNKIHLSFNRQEKTIIGYVAIFGVFRYSILVAENINFKLILPVLDHTLNPLTGEILDQSIIQAPIISKNEVINPPFLESHFNKLCKDYIKIFSPISFEEAVTVFDDPFHVNFYDPDHSIDEHRYIIIGRSQKEQILLISYTERENIIRLISARKATLQERYLYEHR
jgi:uncharacterized protein